MVRFYFHILLWCISCGVNTGNPGNNGSSTKGTTLMFDLSSQSTQRTFELNVESIQLTGSGSPVSLNSNAIYARSGQTITLFSQKNIPSDQYQEISLVLNSETPLSVYDENNEKIDVLIPPLSIYEEEIFLTSADDIGLLFRNFSSPLNIVEGSDQTFTLDYDITSQLVPLSEANEIIKEYYKDRDQNTIVFDILVEDLNFEEWDIECSSTSSTCSENDALFLIDVHSTQVDRICLYNSSVAESSIEGDTNCLQAQASGYLTYEYDFYETIINPGDYRLVLRNSSEVLVNKELSFSVGSDYLFYYTDSEKLVEYTEEDYENESGPYTEGAFSPL